MYEKKYWQKRGRWLRKNPICHLPFYKCVEEGYPMNKRSKINWNYLLIAPALIISVCVILVPGIMTIVYSFTDWNGLSPDINFIGLQNYQELFYDNMFHSLFLPYKPMLGLSYILLKIHFHLSFLK